jgi:serine protease
MYNNIFNLSYNADTGLSPSQNLNEHGTWVAGIIGSEQNNNYQISGVAPKSKLISVSMSGLSSPQGVLNRINGMNWAMTNGADVMNCSWRASYSLDLLNDAIRNISINGRNGLGTVIVYCAGNYDGIPQHSTMWYPAKSDLNLISVGSTTINGNRYIGSCFGTNLDVVAPGHNIITTASSNGLNYVTGTSFAAPHVSGIAALILSVNPCLSANQVRDIIEKTCQKVGSYAYATTADRPNGTWNIEMGYGLVDAHAAVLLAQAMNSSTLDLMVKDTPTDFGIQPNTTSPILWNSPDIWVRNQQDAVQEHQNPQFNPTVPNYIYVKVTNKSCATSTGAEKLKIYCSIPNYGTTSSSFRSAIAPVNSSVTLIGTVDIPVLSAGQETIVSMPWNVPFFVSCDQTVWNTFLLTKIISPTDLNAFTEVTNTYTNIKNNNNIAAKSIMVINTQVTADAVLSGSVGIDNATNTIKNVKFEIIKETSETGKAIYEEAEISLKMDNVLYTAWERGGKLSNNISATSNEKIALVTNNLVQLNNTIFNPNEKAALELKFNFLTEELTDKTEYLYHVVQKNATSNEIEGGCTFVIQKNNRPVFLADAGTDKAKDKNEPIAISASQISEPAIYNWYDSLGNLIYTGKDLTITTDIATKYKLEVIATADGFKDYSEINVSIKPSTISAISPNPTSSTISVDYKINETGTAYLMILGNYGTTYASNNYILDSKYRKLPKQFLYNRFGLQRTNRRR